MGLDGELLGRYRTLYEDRGAPDWAFPDIPPPIPLVGRDYRVGDGLLVYASAENLSDVWNKPDHGRWLEPPTAWNRHRLRFDEWSPGEADEFPTVHIHPIRQGGLLIAAAFIWNRMGQPVPALPSLFVEQLALANFGKFSIRSSTNRDYASSTGKLRASVPYVAFDLEVLRPAVVLLPATMWRRTREALRPHLGATRVVPAYQCQPRVINVYLRARYAEHARALRDRYKEAPWCGWFKRLSGGLNENLWSYLAHVEDVLAASSS